MSTSRRLVRVVRSSEVASLKHHVLDVAFVTALAAALQRKTDRRDACNGELRLEAWLRLAEGKGSDADRETLERLKLLAVQHRSQWSEVMERGHLLGGSAKSTERLARELRQLTSVGDRPQAGSIG